MSGYEQIYSRVVGYFGGEGEAKSWLNSPCFELGGRVPALMLDDPGGAELVMNTLGRLEYGAF